VKNADRSEASRETVLRAAIETLEAVGYSRLRTIDVAKRSGLSEGTLFHYFATKQELVAAATERALHDLLLRTGEAFQALEPPVAVRSMLQVLWELLADRQTSWLHELFAAIQGDPDLERVVGPVIEATADAIDSAGGLIIQQFLPIPEEERRNAADLSIWAIQGLVTDQMAGAVLGQEGELLDYLSFLYESIYPQPSVDSATIS
jgi:AcrR family transcriptional regulator